MINKFRLFNYLLNDQAMAVPKNEKYRLRIY